MSQDYAAPPLMSFEAGLQLPETSIGFVLNLDTEGLPNPHPMAAKRVDVRVIYDGKTIDLTWVEFLSRLWGKN